MLQFVTIKKAFIARLLGNRVFILLLLSNRIIKKPYFSLQTVTALRFRKKRKKLINENDYFITEKVLQHFLC